MLSDTTPESDERYHQLLRAMTGEQRLRAAAALSKGVRRLAIAGIRDRHPLASDEEVRVRLAVRLYGRAAAQRLFGPVPADAV